MLLHSDIDPHEHGTSNCVLCYNKKEAWLQAVWYGDVDPIRTVQQTKAYLSLATQAPCALLLNDNTQLLGPSFDSLDWLLNVWLPQAAHLGLRYVAHVVQLNQHQDFFTWHIPQQLPFELQIFQEVADAQRWLREVRADVR